MRRLLALLLLVSFAAPAVAQRPIPVPKVPTKGDGFFGVTIVNVGKIVMIRQVFKDTAAEKYKARPGDIILKIGGKPVESVQNMINMVTTKPSGTELKFVILRGDKQVSWDVKLGKRPDPQTELPIKLSPLEEERKAYLETIGATAEAYVKVFVKGLTALRAGQFKRARMYLSVNHAMAEANRDTATKDEKPAAEAIVRRTDWLMKMARLDVKLPENLGKVKGGDDELAKQIEKLVGQLGHAKYKVREKATKELLRIGEPALTALSRVLDSDDLEQRSRAKRVVAAIQARLEVKAPDWGPTVYEVAEAKGESWVLKRVLGASLTPKGTYRAIVYTKGETRGKSVVFSVSADDKLVVKRTEGAEIAVGTVLVFLAPLRKSSVD